MSTYVSEVQELPDRFNGYKSLVVKVSSDYFLLCSGSAW